MLARPAKVEPRRKSRLSLLIRMSRTLLRKRCDRCAEYDHEEGLNWRHRPTHVFDDGSSLALWNDVLALTAKDAGVAVIPDKRIGYCRAHESIVDGRSLCCDDFSRG
jgi:hypothetical protein